MVSRGEIWWADIGTPRGAEAGYRRPVIVVQTDQLNDSRLKTVLSIPLTTNLDWAAISFNYSVSAKVSGLNRDSVAQTHLIVAVPKSDFVERVGKLSMGQLDKLLDRLDLALGR